jgi:hypothetical protein
MTRLGQIFLPEREDEHGGGGETLVRLGYTSVWHPEGGFLAWEEAGYPLIKRRRPRDRGAHA